jgi:hypothetical protein
VLPAGQSFDLLSGRWNLRAPQVSRQSCSEGSSQSATQPYPRIKLEF